MRWIWIDRFLAFESGKFARAVKNLSRAEDVYAEHFPGYPVMPAALVLEGLAQTGGILVGEARNFQEKVVLAKITRAVIHRDMLAGERLIYETTVQVLRDEGVQIAGRVLVENQVTVEAEIFFAHLDQAMSSKMFGEHNFVFSGELKYLLGLARAAAQSGPSP